MVKVKKFGSWLESRDIDMHGFITAKSIYEGIFFKHKDRDLAALGAQHAKLVSEIWTGFVKKYHDLIAGQAFRQVGITPTHLDVHEEAARTSLKNIVATLAPNSSWLRQDTRPESALPLAMEDVKSVADFIFGVDPIMAGRPGATPVGATPGATVRPPTLHADPNIAFPHAFADDSIFHGNKQDPKKEDPATPGVLKPHADPAQQGHAGMNRELQGAIAARASMSNINMTSPMTIIGKMVKLYGLREPSNWGELVTFGYTYQNYYLPQITRANMTHMKDLAQVGAEMRGDPPPGAARAAASPAQSVPDYYKAAAERWVTDNMSERISAGGMTLEKGLNLLRAAAHLVDSAGGITKSGVTGIKIDGWANLVATFIRNKETDPVLRAAIGKHIDEKYVSLLLPPHQTVWALDPAGSGASIRPSANAIKDSSNRNRDTFQTALH